MPCRARIGVMAEMSGNERISGSFGGASLGRFILAICLEPEAHSELAELPESPKWRK